MSKVSISSVATTEDFEQEVLNSQVPVLVDFSSPWCGPCVMMEPILQELADQQQVALKVVQVNVEEGGQIATKYAVASLPTFMLFVGPDIRDRLSGFITKERLLTRLRTHIPGIQ